MLVKIEVKKDVDIGMDGYCCGICHDGSKTNWRCKVKLPGIFELEKEEEMQVRGDESQSWAAVKESEK